MRQFYTLDSDDNFSIAETARKLQISSLDLKKEVSDSKLKSASGMGKRQVSETEQLSAESLGAKITTDYSSLNSNEFQLRDYQLELAEDGIKGDNTIICAPTGSGKTHTAAYICYQRCKKMKVEKYLSPKIIFVVPLRALKEQQKIAFKVYFDFIITIDDEVTVKQALTNDNQNPLVIMMTGQNLLNALNEPESSGQKVKIDEIDILVMDECHHTIKNHPYAKIMQHCIQSKYSNRKVPQLIGLSASLGAGFKGEELVSDDISKTLNHYVKLCAFYHTYRIAHVKKHKEHLKTIVNSSREQILEVEERKHGKFKDFLMEISHRIMDDSEVIFPSKDARHEIDSTNFEQWIVNLGQNASTNGEVVTKDACFYLERFRKAYLLYENFQIIDGYEYLKELFESSDLEVSPINRKKWSKLFFNYQNLIEEEIRNDCLENNELVEKLLKEIADIFKTNENSQGMKKI